MLVPTVVAFVVTHASCWQRRREEMGQVMEAVSWFLVDLYGVDLTVVVARGNLPMFRWLLGTGERGFGQGVPHDQVEDAMRVAMIGHHMAFLEFYLEPTSDLVTLHRPKHSDRQRLEALAACRGDHQYLQWVYDKTGKFGDLSRVLQTAVEYGQCAIVKLLVEKKLLGPASKQDCTAALASARERGHVEIVQSLLHCLDMECDLCLMESAIRGGRVKQAAGFQLASKGTIESPHVPEHDHVHEHHNSSSSSTTTIHDLVQEESVLVTLATDSPIDELQVFEQLFAASYALVHTQLLFMASKGGDVRKVQWLYQHFPEEGDLPKDAAVKFAINAACTCGHVDVVKLFVNHGHHAGSPDLALRSGELALVRFLEDECGVDEIKDLDTISEFAACSGHTEMVRWCEARRQRRKGYPMEAFQCAAESGNLSMLQLLLSSPHNTQVYVTALAEGFRAAQLGAAKCVYADMSNHEQFQTLKKQMWRAINREAGTLLGSLDWEHGRRWTCCCF